MLLSSIFKSLYQVRNDNWNNESIFTKPMSVVTIHPKLGSMSYENMEEEKDDSQKYSSF
jgi:hypothetical protein